MLCTSYGKQNNKQKRVWMKKEKIFDYNEFNAVKSIYSFYLAAFFNKTTLTFRLSNWTTPILVFFWGVFILFHSHVITLPVAPSPEIKWRILLRERFMVTNSRTSTNSHLSIYIDSYKNLSTMATSPQGQRPLKRVLNCENSLSTTNSFFSDWWESQERSWNLLLMGC